MVEDRNVVIVTGIPGVGKTTVINTAVQMVKDERKEEVLILNIGTEMFELASERGFQTKNGFLIGLPEWVVKAIQPKTVVLVEADPEKIAGRRTSDETRTRDAQLTEEIDTHQRMCRAAAVSVGTLTGATVRIIRNREGKVEEAASELAATLME